MAKVAKDPSGCWFWMAARRSHGYGVFWNGKRQVYAHRHSYECFVGPIPEGLTIDHLCRVRYCVNPDHLEPVTQKENNLRGESTMARQARQTHCHLGHELAGENLYVYPNGQRKCLVCVSAKRDAKNAALRKKYADARGGNVRKWVRRGGG